MTGLHVILCPSFGPSISLYARPTVCTSTCQSVYLFLSFCPTACLSVWLSFCPSVFFCPSVNLPVHLSIRLYNCLSVWGSICPSIFLFSCRRIYLSSYLSVKLSVDLFVHLSFCLAVCLLTCLSLHLFIWRSFLVQLQFLLFFFIFIFRLYFVSAPLICLSCPLLLSFIPSTVFLSFF